MKIYVVKTCDGDVYFSASRVAYKMKALRMAAEQVMENDLSRYCVEDREAVKAAWDKSDEKGLWEALSDCGAIREAYTQE